MTKDNWLTRLFSIKRPEAPKPIEPGLYHAVREAEGMYSRFHLRVETDGSGLLIANAATAARLTPSGVVITKGLLDGKAKDAILETLQTYFQGAPESRMRQDIEKMQSLINQLVTPSDTYPMFNLDDAALTPYTAQLIAPLEAALPLAEPEKLLPILDRLWEVGIPNITLFAPPNLDAEQLIRAVEHAEDLGMIAGVRARATDLQAGDLLPRLAQAGVDHVTFLYASTEEAVHDALCGPGDYAAAHKVINWLEENQVCAIAEVPLVQTTLNTLEDTVTEIIDLGADNLSFVAYATNESPALTTDDGALLADAMPQVGTMVEEAAHAAQGRFIWEPPVQRNPQLPLPEQVQCGPRSAGDVAIRVEPDGTVIPPRGPYQSAGNLLQDSWESIWENEAFRIYRERVEAPTHCDICPGLTICAADCPREPKGWAQYSKN